MMSHTTLSAQFQWLNQTPLPAGNDRIVNKQTLYSILPPTLTKIRSIRTFTCNQMKQFKSPTVYYILNAKGPRTRET